MTLHLSQRTSKVTLPLPYWVFIDGHPIGVVKRKADVRLNNGTYTLGIWLVFRFWRWEARLGKDIRLLMLNEDVSVEFWHSEPVWDTIFNIDLVLWLITLFSEIPHPWNIIYHILSDGFFLIWLIRLWMKRKEYLTIKISE